MTRYLDVREKCCLNLRFFCFDDDVDVEGIMTVINYDFPNSSEDYIHRIGRTGRSNATGTAYTFFTSANQRQAKDLVAVMTEAKQEISPELHQMSAMGFGGFGGGRYGKFGGGRYGGGGKFGGGNRSYGGGGPEGAVSVVNRLTSGFEHHGAI